MASGSPTVDVLHPLTIPTLAVVKVNWDDRRDYIQNFVPLVAHSLALDDEEAVSLPEAQQRVQIDWGLTIPQAALKAILSRAKRDGLVRKEHGVFKKNFEALEEADLGSVRESALREYAALVTQLAEFANQHFGRDWTTKDAEKALMSFVDVQIEPILAASVSGEKLLALPKSEGFGSVVVNRFVLEVASSDPSAFGYLETIVKGTVLASVVYLDEAFRSGTTHLGEVEIFLDTPFLLLALGFAAPELRDPCTETLELLRHQGAKLRVFDHTVKEIEGVLDNAARCYRTAGKAEFPGDVIEFFLSENLESSDVELLIAGLDERLSGFGIDRVVTPAHTEGLTLDETALEKRLGDEIGYRNNVAKMKDLDSLTSIHRLRGGQPCHRIDSCKAIFVTTNTALVRSSRGFFRDAYGVDGFPLCLSDSGLTAIVWLMEPREASDLPRKQMLANSFAALNPSDKLWRRYLAEIRRLHAAGDLSDEDVGLLVFSSEARSELIDLTLGDVDAFAEGTVPEVLEAARASARAGVEEELADKNNEIGAEKERRERAEAKAEDEAAQRLAAETRSANIRAAHGMRRREVATRISGVLAWATFGLLAAFLLVGSAALALGGIFAAAPLIVRVLVATAVVFTLVFGCANAILGWSAHRVALGIRERLAPRVETVLERLFAVEEGASESADGDDREL
jgi:hypothetical protein